jgi:uncharacterized protein (TIGR03435 family)
VLSNRIFRKRTFSRMRLLFAVTAVLLIGIPASLAQSSAQSVKIPQKLAFDIASVKENKSNSEPTSNVPLDRSDTYSLNGGRLSATGQPLIAYLIFAYKVNVNETYGGLMRRLPAWAVTDKFDIQARTENQNPTKDQMRLMMQSLLEDRFKLAVHRENRQVPIFALTLIKPGKTGPQLKRHEATSSCLPEEAKAQRGEET